MKDKKLEDLLSILDNTQELKKHDKPLDNFIKFTKEIDLTPGNYRLNLDVLFTIFKNKTGESVPKDARTNLKLLGFKLDTPRKGVHIVYISQKNKEELTLRYAQKISEKIYKDD